MVLNLVYSEKSDIKYQIQKFPDGQQNIVITGYSTEGYKGDLSYLKQCCKSIQIKSRLNNWLDLELISCAVASLRELDIEEIHLYVPYIMGARSDRKFEEGGNNYLKDVICPIINSLNFKTVTCIDPHSDVLEACIKGFRKLNNNSVGTNLISFAFKDLVTKLDKNIKAKTPVEALYNNIALVSPDAGASKKIYKLAEQIGYKGDIITCSKDRDVNGKLTKTVVPLDKNKVVDKDYIIIDDICDGGATFINIAKEIQKQMPTKNKIYLIVTHGIFSKGFEELDQYFDGVYCTNSYSDYPSNERLKQLNIF